MIFVFLAALAAIISMTAMGFFSIKIITNHKQKDLM